MIDSHRIQQELKDVKLSSMTDVVNFVIQQVYKMMSYDPIQDLSYRIAELQKPKGLDQVMIEEVKTLIQAILQQKQDQIKKDLSRTVHNNIEIALEQENTRRSLKQIDYLQILNTAHQTRKNSSYSVPKNGHENLNQADAILKEIQELKSIVSEKAERREFNKRILDIQKQISIKMSINQTENIVKKFQQEVFNKINQSSLFMQKVQYNIKKTLFEDFSVLKKEINESSKMKQIKSNLNKTEKKVKKIQNQMEDLSIKFHKETSELKSQVKDSIEQFFTLLEGLSEEKKKKSLRTEFSCGVWQAQKNYNMNNMAICWSKQLSNDDCEQFLFEAKKSQIMLAEAGYYQMQILVNGCQKSPNIFINSQFWEKIETKEQLSSHNSYTFIQIVRLLHPRSLLSIRLEPNTSYNTAIIKITKIA